MSNKSKALRLADVLERSVNNPHRYWQGEAATELRRLHEVNQELLGALNDALGLIDDLTPLEGNTVRKARAAIAKATGGQS